MPGESTTARVWLIAELAGVVLLAVIACLAAVVQLAPWLLPGRTP
jgi:hypothetical protein